MRVPLTWARGNPTDPGPQARLSRASALNKAPSATEGTARHVCWEGCPYDKRVSQSAPPGAAGPATHPPPG